MSTYADICKAECTGCANEWRLHGKGKAHIHPNWFGNVWTDAELRAALRKDPADNRRVELCTAPTKDQFIERLSADLTAAQNDAKEAHKWANRGGNPFVLDGVHQQCKSDPRDVHLIYGTAHGDRETGFVCELHSFKEMLTTAQERIRLLEGAIEGAEHAHDCHSIRLEYGPMPPFITVCDEPVPFGCGKCHKCRWLQDNQPSHGPCNCWKKAVLAPKEPTT